MLPPPPNYLPQKIKFSAARIRLPDLSRLLSLLREKIYPHYLKNDLPAHSSLRNAGF